MKTQDLLKTADILLDTLAEIERKNTFFPMISTDVLADAIDELRNCEYMVRMCVQQHRGSALNNACRNSHDAAMRLGELVCVAASCVSDFVRSAVRRS